METNFMKGSPLKLIKRMDFDLESETSEQKKQK